MWKKFARFVDRAWLRVYVIFSWVIPDMLLELLGLDYILWLEILSLRKELEDDRR